MYKRQFQERVTTFRSIALFLSVEVVLKTYQVQDIISFVEHLIQQVLLRDVRLVLNTELRDQKTLNKIFRQDIISA